MIRNKDKYITQYVKYKDILGKENVPTTFEKFQNMKYSNVKDWGLLKGYKREIQNQNLMKLTLN